MPLFAVLLIILLLAEDGFIGEVIAEAEPEADVLMVVLKIDDEEEMGVLA